MDDNRKTESVSTDLVLRSTKKDQKEKVGFTDLVLLIDAKLVGPFFEVDVPNTMAKQLEQYYRQQKGYIVARDAILGTEYTKLKIYL